MGVWSVHSFLYMDMVLSLVIAFYFATVMASYSILGFYPVEFMHSFKFWLKLIYLTFRYIRGCALGHNWWTASALDVVHPEGKGKGKTYGSEEQNMLMHATKLPLQETWDIRWRSYCSYPSVFFWHHKSKASFADLVSLLSNSFCNIYTKLHQLIKIHPLTSTNFFLVLNVYKRIY